MECEGWFKAFGITGMGLSESEMDTTQITLLYPGIWGRALALPGLWST